MLARGDLHNLSPTRGHISLQEQEREGPEESRCGGTSQGKSLPGRKEATWGIQQGEGSAQTQVWKKGKSVRSSVKAGLCQDVFG